jgi:tetratricopeptide (TPR) repeat protein
MNKFMSICLIVFGIFFTPFVAAENLDTPPTVGEIKVWPPVCQDRWKYGEDRSSPVVQKWQSLLGADYVHLHHYCLGINFVNRANRSWDNKKNKTYFLSKAELNMKYMLSHTQESFILRPDIYLQLGEVYVQQGDVGAAIAQFQNAIRLRNDYWRSYAALSDLYKKNNNPSEALKVIEEGLKHVPDSRALKSRQQKLSK